MQLVPLGSNPNETLQIVLAGQNCAIELRSLDGYAYADSIGLDNKHEYLAFSLSVSGVSITNTALCLNRKRLLVNRQYLGFVGDFIFVDTQGDEAPQFAGLGTRWLLVYLEAADL